MWQAAQKGLMSIKLAASKKEKLKSENRQKTQTPTHIQPE